MKAFASIMGGLCLFEEGQQRHFVNVVDMSPVSAETAHLVCGAIDDWKSIDRPDREAVLRDIAVCHGHARGVSNIEVCLSGVSAGLQKELLAEVEDLLKALGARSQLEAMLLRAPLASIDGLPDLIRVCLSEGLGATASLLERLRESQPLLRRVADRWLSIPDELFAAFPDGRRQVWRMAVGADVVTKTLAASTFQAVEGAWQKLFFGLAIPAERTAVSKISKAVAKALFPAHSESWQDGQTLPNREPEDSSDAHRQDQPRGQTARDSHERALKQVGAIVTAVAEGRDANARLFVRDMVDAQLKEIGGEEHAVKSLCNIAQQCAEMFRTDFEYECLKAAIDVKSGDAWTLVQLADHFKRVGRFDDAIETLRQAETFGEERVARSSLADVYVQMGKFQDAIAIYDDIPGAGLDAVIRTAKANALRRWGHLDDAQREYDQIIREGLGTHRVFAGQAEIAKRQGRLGEACDIYRNLLGSNELDVLSAVIYRMSLANVLLRVGDLTNAYQQIDQVVQLRPFSQQAKAFRAAIAGLLGNPAEAISGLPQLGQTQAFNEWVSEYVRGLLLLMLDRYADARVALLQNVEERFLDKDATGMLRLGAAVCYLRTRDGVERAAETLNEVPDMKDAFADTIRAALQYHVAVALRQDAEIMRLETELGLVDDDDVKALVTAISQRDWKKAWRLEVRTLLRLAA